MTETFNPDDRFVVKAPGTIRFVFKKVFEALAVNHENGKMEKKTFGENEVVLAVWWSGMDDKGFHDMLPRDFIDIKTTEFTLIEVPFGAVRMEHE